MANPKIVYTDLSAITYTATSTDGAYPLTNLNDYRPNVYWRCGAAPSNPSYLNLVFATPQYIDTVVLGEVHNLKTSIGATIPVYYKTYPGGVDTAFGNLLTTVDSASVAVVKTTAVLTQQIYLDISNVGTQKVQINNVFAGTSVKFTTAYNWGFKKEDAEYVTNQVVTLGGNTRSSQNYAGRLKYELQFTLQDNTLRSAFQTFHRAVRGSMYPFFFIDVNDQIRYMKVEDYVPLTGTSYGRNDVSLTMQTFGATY
jgi:hypothetical protein